VAALERCVERIKAGVRDIDARVSRVSQTATRIGDRLQVRTQILSAGDGGGASNEGFVATATYSSLGAMVRALAPEEAEWSRPSAWSNAHSSPLTALPRPATLCSITAADGRGDAGALHGGA
jgi:hypothetical protein